MLQYFVVRRVVLVCVGVVLLRCAIQGHAALPRLIVFSN